MNRLPHVLALGLAAGSLAFCADPTKLPTLEPISTNNDIKPVVATVVVVESTVKGTEAFPKALTAANAAMAKLRDYSGYMVREERINGKLMPAQTAELRVRCEPFSIYTKTVAPKELLGQELAYMSGRKEEKIRVKPAGKAGADGFFSYDITDSKANVDSKHTLLNTGIASVLKRIESAMDAEKKAKTKPEVLVADYKFDGKACTRYEVICEMPHKMRLAAKMVVYFENESKLPIRFEMYDAPKNGETTGELLECVSFMSLKLNGGLGDGVFDK
jgi:outer membrane lipoprotein-sorting protein